MFNIGVQAKTEKNLAQNLYFLSVRSKIEIQNPERTGIFK